MTVLFHDIHKRDEHQMSQHRLENTNYDEVLYADDTICVSTSTRAMNRHINSIEQEGAKYGLKLNRGKCEVVANMKVDVHFGDGAKVKQVDEATYLGCEINADSDMHREIGKRIGKCMITLKRLDLFWLHGNCNVKVKLRVYNAIVRSKLMYGLDSAQLNESHQQRLDVFQLKGLRKILGMKTTYIERSNTNDKVIREANRSAGLEGSNKALTKMSRYYTELRSKRGIRVLKARDSDPAKFSSFCSTAKGWEFSNKRVGRPKIKWVSEMLKQLWEEKRATIGETHRQFRNTQYNPQREDMRQALVEHLNSDG